MKLHMSRVEDRRYQTTAVRADGVTVVVASHGFAHRIPRDLAHYAIEQTLDLRHGFWGAVAAGAMLPGVSLAPGQSAPAGADERSQAVVAALSPYVSDARQLVAAFDELIDRTLETRWPQVDPALQTLTMRRGPRLMPLTKTDVARVAVAWNELLGRWDHLSVGAGLDLDWSVALASGSYPAIKP